MNDITHEIILIAAIGENNELGKNGNLIWNIPGDLQRFKQKTIGHPIIMGYGTYVSIGHKPLPGRTNIVMALNEDPQGDVAIARSINEAIAIAESSKGSEKIFVIGGGEIFRLFIEHADTLDLTVVHARDAAADVYFPQIDEKIFAETKREEKVVDGTSFAFVQYVRA